MTTKGIDLSLAQYKPINQYSPRIGDFIVWHGFFTHYYGVISGVDDSKKRIKAIKSGMPILLFKMNMDEMENKTNNVVLNLDKIRSSKGAYAVQQNGTGIWYV